MNAALYLSLGTNLGDRYGNILMALEKLDKAFGCHYSTFSDVIETEAMGFCGAPFLNAAVLYEIDAEKWSPDAILDLCKGIERSMGRTDTPEYDSAGQRVYHSRSIDIDILFFGDVRMQTERLVIPHKGIELRPFVTIPLKQIAKPELVASFPEYFAYLCDASNDDE